MHVLIAGGGVGGLALAQTLRKQGITFEVFERDASKDSRFQGWAIVLHTFLPELMASIPSDMPDLKESTHHLQPLDLPAQIVYYYPDREDRLGFEDCAETPMIRAERYRLRNWLSTNIPIQWGKRIQRVEQDDHGVTAYFDDGTSAKGDILVGADGINSVVRQELLQKPASELLNVVPLAAIVGQVTLSGAQFKRQLELAHSGYTLIKPELGFINFVGTHDVAADGLSARFFWMMMRMDASVDAPDHWLKTATQQQKRDHVMEAVQKLPPQFREIYELTPVEGIKAETHIWRDLELESLPAGRVLLLGDAAHAMTPFRGEGGYHTFLDALALSKWLGRLEAEGNVGEIAKVKEMAGAYNEEMLKRGVESVRFSRASYDEAKKKAENRQPFVAPMRPLARREIMVGVKA